MVTILSISDEELIQGRNVTLDKEIPDDISIDILVNCGDISPSYLEYLQFTYTPKERIMVHGNHDSTYYTSQDQHPERGYYSSVYQGMFILNQGEYTIPHTQFSTDKDITVLGYSGAKAHGTRPFFFTDDEATSYFRRMKRLYTLKNLFSKNLDPYNIILSHAAPRIHDVIPEIDTFHDPSDGLAHFFYTYPPDLWFYGHIHPRYTNEPLDFVYTFPHKKTHILNTVPYKVIDYDPHNGDVEVLFPKDTPLKEITFTT